MEKVLWSIIAASALCVVSAHVKRQYHFVYDLKNQTEARSYCREKYTDLATIDNMEDMNILNNMVDLHKINSLEESYGVWIGLYDDMDSWRWSMSDKSFYKHGETEFRNWRSGEPNNGYSNELCTSMQHDGEWFDIGCDASFKAVCMDVTGPTVTFVLTNTSMTWPKAQSYCREHHTDLASVRNISENQKVKEVRAAEIEFWIGLFRDSWKWSDGSNSSFRYWRNDTGEPNGGNKETCVVANFYESGKWENWVCDRKAAFICYNVPVSQQVIKVKVKKSSSVDLNDPAVMEDILKQLKQRLKDQGVNENITLSWRKQPDGKIFHKDERRNRKDGEKEEL